MPDGRPIPAAIARMEAETQELEARNRLMKAQTQGILDKLEGEARLAKAQAKREELANQQLALQAQQAQMEQAMAAPMGGGMVIGPGGRQDILIDAPGQAMDQFMTMPAAQAQMGPMAPQQTDPMAGWINMLREASQTRAAQGQLPPEQFYGLADRFSAALASPQMEEAYGAPARVILEEQIARLNEAQRKRAIAGMGLTPEQVEQDPRLAARRGGTALTAQEIGARERERQAAMTVGHKERLKETLNQRLGYARQLLNMNRVDDYSQRAYETALQQMSAYSRAIREDYESWKSTDERRALRDEHQRLVNEYRSFVRPLKQLPLDFDPESIPFIGLPLDPDFPQEQKQVSGQTTVAPKIAGGQIIAQSKDGTARLIRKTDNTLDVEGDWKKLPLEARRTLDLYMTEQERK